MKRKSFITRLRWLILAVFVVGLTLVGFGYLQCSITERIIGVLICAFDFTACAVMMNIEEEIIKNHER